VVENPVDLTRFDPSRADGRRLRDELAIRDDDHVLAMIGQITPWKGHDTAIRAFARLAERFDDMRLLIVGEPVFTTDGTRHDNISYLDALRTLAHDLHVEQRVTFVGGRDDIPDVLAATDLVLVPSWDEPFGRVVIEAMSMRVPVIATAVGGPAEILSSGGGVLVPPSEPERWARAAAPLLADPEWRRRMGDAGRRVAVERYGLERYVARVLDGYDVALERSGGHLAASQLGAERD
jgi:glycosyltransferase involved in cell wall biosynthesis